MRFHRCFVLILVAGFLLSLVGRSEPDFSSAHFSVAFHVADVEHQHDDSPQLPSSPLGDHKDQQGCYHSHAPFLAVKTIFTSQTESTVLVARKLAAPVSIDLTNILRPPRA